MKSTNNKTKKRTLTELEGVCLGMVFRHQPCTAYRIRRQLKASPSPHWSASAGSVYPLLERLKKPRYISAETDDEDGRGRKYLSVSTSGRRELRNWILAGTGHEVISVTNDPIRTRSFFLDVITRPDQKEFLEKLIEQMESLLQDNNEYLDQQSQEDDLFGFLGAKGVCLATEARIEWLKLVLSNLSATD